MVNSEWFFIGTSMVNSEWFFIGTSMVNSEWFFISTSMVNSEWFSTLQRTKRFRFNFKIITAVLTIANLYTGHHNVKLIIR